MASPTPSQPDSLFCGLSQSESNAEDAQTENLVTKCGICKQTSAEPKVLPCLHTFCQVCLKKLSVDHKCIKCPVCVQDCTLPSDGISGLLSDFAISNCLENVDNFEGDSQSLLCTGCKNKDTHAVAHCSDCKNYLCGNCLTAHQYMHCFEGHQVVNLKGETNSDFKVEKLLCCPYHRNETLLYFCLTCDMPVCKECISFNHAKESHEFDHISKIGPKQIEILANLFGKSKGKLNNLRNAAQCIDDKEACLEMQLSKSQAEVNATFKFYCSILEERKQELLKELHEAFNAKIISLNFTKIKIQEMIENMLQLSIFVKRIMDFSSQTEILMFKHLIDTKLQKVIAYNPEIDLQPLDFEFVSNYQAIEIGVKNTFGYIHHSDAQNWQIQPTSRPNVNFNSDQAYHNGYGFDPKIATEQVGLPSPFGSFSPNLIDMNQYDKWSNGASDAIQDDIFDKFVNITEQTYHFTNKINLQPMKMEIKRQKMTYHCKFGEFGIMIGQFTEPSGVALNAQNDIIVADANNCRVQVFDKEGRFKFHFGECGRSDGKMLYPNRVAVIKQSGDIIVTERSPVHQVQVYNQYGQFIRKFGTHYLEHPRGVTVDNKGRIILIECKVMRILIFDQLGNILHKFGCAKHLEFPNGVVTNDKQEIFVSDNRTHCVKVFNYDGAFLRIIGGEGLTNYPIGVCINSKGEVLIADNHNNFNITVFTQEGQLVNAFESKVKHEQCLDVALMSDSNVVLTSKDYRVYIYNIVPFPGILF